MRVKHIVMWRLRETARGTDRGANALELQRRLLELDGLVPGMLGIEVGINVVAGEAAADLVLLSEFEDWDALARYRDHPDHQAVLALVREIAAERRVVDYELD